MNYKNTIEKIAHRELSEAELVKFTADQWGMIVTWLRENEGEITGNFPITSVHRDDLSSIGFDVSKVSDEDMHTVARKMADHFLEYGGYWTALEVIAIEILGLKQGNM